MLSPSTLVSSIYKDVKFQKLAHIKREHLAHTVYVAKVGKSPSSPAYAFLLTAHADDAPEQTTIQMHWESLHVRKYKSHEEANKTLKKYNKKIKSSDLEFQRVRITQDHGDVSLREKSRKKTSVTYVHEESLERTVLHAETQNSILPVTRTSALPVYSTFNFVIVKA